MNMVKTRQACRYLSLAASITIASVMSVGLASLASAQHMPPRSAGAGGYTLQLNDSGDAVANLQYQLSTMGYYNGAVDGYFDAATQEAVSRFQQAQGLVPDGIVGPATGQMLFQGAPAYGASGSSFGQGGWQDQAPNASVDAPQGVVQLNASGAQVAELQSRLAELGYYNGSISGTFDYET
ncbi:MAG TPA: peptidoglycan-binding domain-containing protein, partial [Allocoleopsis sp.]